MNGSHLISGCIVPPWLKLRPAFPIIELRLEECFMHEKGREPRMEKLATTLNELGCFPEPVNGKSEGSEPGAEVVLSLLSLFAIDILGATTEAEFVDKLCKSFFSNTRSLTGVKVSTGRYIKIFGKRSSEVKQYRTDGLAVEAHFETLDPRDDRFLNTALVIADVQLRNVLKLQELKNLVIYDSLTGAISRRAGLEFLDKELKKATRHGSHAFLVFLDIDDFKDYNDRFGHVAGDRVLKEFVSICKNNLRGGDLVIRYGGDEFLLLLFTNKPDRVIARVTELTPVRFSYGIASLTEAKTVTELVALADGRMYEHKKRKKILERS